MCGIDRYQTLKLPGIPGIEGVGFIEEVGADTRGFSVGDRVAYVDPGYGAYAQVRVLAADLATVLPASISDEVAAALLLKGLTACMLLRRVYPVKRDSSVLIHAAAGGVGQLLVRWAKHLGARVLATVGSDEKAQIARECGADEVILYRKHAFSERVRELTADAGVDVVFDSVGHDTFEQSVDCLGYGGMAVSFGQSSGPIAPFAISRLAQRSLSISRPIVFHFLRKATARAELLRQTLEVIQSGVLKARIGITLPLSRAAQAHVALESRSTTGSIVLLPFEQ